MCYYRLSTISKRKKKVRFLFPRRRYTGEEAAQIIMDEILTDNDHVHFYNLTIY